LFAQSPDAGYNLNIHVSQSRIGTGRANTQELCVLVDGAKYEMESLTNLPKGVIVLGDYKANLIKDQQKSTHEFNRTYSLMFPDGSTRDFVVTGQVE
jgi:hypothetical protein